MALINFLKIHCVKSFRIRGFSGPYIPAFELNTERYGVFLYIQLDNTNKYNTNKY